MRKLKFVITLLFLFLANKISAQNNFNDQYFYYYKGEKQYLQLDTHHLFVSGNSKQSIAKMMSDISQRAVDIQEDNTIKTLDKVIGLKQTQQYSFWQEIELKNSSYSRNEYVNYVKKLKNSSSNLIISPYFKDKQGKKIGLSHYFYVKLKRKEDYKILKQYAIRHQVAIVGYNKFMPLWFTLSVTPTSPNALTMANTFYESGLFEYAEPDLMIDIKPQTIGIEENYLMSQSSPNDEFYDRQWGLHNTGRFGRSEIDIQAEDAWTITTGSSTIKVAVFDTGFDINHPDLAANVFGQGYDADTGTSPSIAANSFPHGTSVAGIIAAKKDNQIGVSGVAPDVSLVSISSELSGSAISLVSKLADGFNWAWQNGVDIINNSWGDNELRFSILDDAITNALTQGRNGLGCVVVFSSGNQSSNFPIYPSTSNPKILSVGAINSSGERGFFSNYGGDLDMVAPGVDIYTTDNEPHGYNFNSYYHPFFTGTSAAAPFVSGVAALVLSVNPNLTVQEVNTIIESSAEKVRTDLYSYTNTIEKTSSTWNNEMGYGLVNAYNAVRLAAGCEKIDRNSTLSQNIAAGQTDIRQAQNRLTANNTISNGAIANYKATTVRLAPGFKAVNGSNFRAQTNLEPCIAPINSQPSRTPATIEKVVYIDNEEVLNQIEDFVNVYPNPTTNLININSKELILEYILTDSFGKTLLYRKINNKGAQLNISNYAKGIYFLNIRTEEGNSITKKVFKE